MSTLGTSALFVSVLGVCAGTVYVLGFTLLHEHVDDDLRGRIFSALYTLVRLCVLVAFAVGPFLSELFGQLSERLVDGELDLRAMTISVPGVRLTLWTAGVIIFLAGFIAASSMRSAARKSLVAVPSVVGSVVRASEQPAAEGERVGEPVSEAG